MDRVLTPTQVAELFQISERVVRAWLREGKLPGLKMGRLWRIRESDLDRFVESLRGEQPVEGASSWSRRDAREGDWRRSLMSEDSEDVNNAVVQIWEAINPGVKNLIQAMLAGSEEPGYRLEIEREVVLSLVNDRRTLADAPKILQRAAELALVTIVRHVRGDIN